MSSSRLFSFLIANILSHIMWLMNFSCKAPSLYKHNKSKQEIFESIVKLVLTHISGLSETLGMPPYDKKYNSASDFYKNLDLKGLKELSREVFVFYLTDPYVSKDIYGKRNFLSGKVV